MALGFCPALLLDINDIANGNAASRKLNIAGFLAMLFCCQNSTASVVNDVVDGAHYTTATIKYRQRPLVTDVQSEDDCDINRIAAYAEWNLPGFSHRQHSFFLDDNTVMKYCADASRTRAAGQPPTQVMNEVYGQILESANVVLRSINRDLLAQTATEFGVNVTTNDDGGKLININTDGSSYILKNGLIDMIRDIQENEICGEPCLVGGGLWTAYNIAKAIECCNAAGLNMGGISLPRFFFDKDSQSIWGADSAGLFSPGTVKFISRNKYVGAFAGQKGSSFFTTLPLPVNEFGCNVDDCLRDLVFDMQLKYIDCPTTLTLNGSPQSVNRGWLVIIGKDYGLWTQPDTAYASGDPLFGTNGILKYFLSNTSYTGGSYSFY